MISGTVARSGSGSTSGGTDAAGHRAKKTGATKTGGGTRTATRVAADVPALTTPTLLGGAESNHASLTKLEGYPQEAGKRAPR